MNWVLRLIEEAAARDAAAGPGARYRARRERLRRVLQGQEELTPEGQAKYDRITRAAHARFEADATSARRRGLVWGVRR